MIRHKLSKFLKIKKNKSEEVEEAYPQLKGSSVPVG
jgi:hypothetical protein